VESAGRASDVIWPLHYHQSSLWEPTSSQAVARVAERTASQ